MTTQPSCPGVYVVEGGTPSVSVNVAATAVPVFLTDFSENPRVSIPKDVCIRVDNWLEYCVLKGLYPRLGEVTVKIESEPLSGGGCSYTYEIILQCHPEIDLALRQYFENGGGPCYILRIGTSDGILSAIKKVREITLLVYLHYTIDSDLRDTYYSWLNSLLGAGNNYFLIADADAQGKAPDTESEYTSVYYPGLIESAGSERPPDDLIEVIGYIDDSGTSVTGFSDLKPVNPDLYAEISATIDSRLARLRVSVTPAAAMAGIYCATDRTRGVWNAPANVPISGALDVAVMVSDTDQGTMNDNGINVIRKLPDSGIVPWGCRTLAGTSEATDTSWRYIQVRRLFNSAEADITKAMQTMMFEPNYQPTWEKTRHAIENYLYSLWRQGALAGSKPEDAYFVQIGKDVTMSDEDISAGKMIAKVGMAAARPAEFIILEFTQSMSM
jgi:hypothetical protein